MIRGRDNKGKKQLLVNELVEMHIIDYDEENLRSRLSIKRTVLMDKKSIRILKRYMEECKVSSEEILYAKEQGAILEDLH